ncbi:unnamed protein product [Notodromas monacha]|uniref:PRMT5 oligomerisation domain-containing protein n=1 Tax=Notodromas monacha TaxID=399045 RepID=A0A7R9GC05_9CRUS|nr:unnamed protein product [Notodromas monacha]CAG0916954.1 unnamed protein product [Notodromas monacha]
MNVVLDFGPSADVNASCERALDAKCSCRFKTPSDSVFCIWRREDFHIMLPGVEKHRRCRFIISVPLAVPSETEEAESTWSEIRDAIGDEIAVRCVSLCLEIPTDFDYDPVVLERWCADNVHFFSLPKAVWVSQADSPSNLVLSGYHEQIAGVLISRKVIPVIQSQDGQEANCSYHFTDWERISYDAKDILSLTPLPRTFGEMHELSDAMSALSPGKEEAFVAAISNAMKAILKGKREKIHSLLYLLGEINARELIYTSSIYAGVLFFTLFFSSVLLLNVENLTLIEVISKALLAFVDVQINVLILHQNEFCTLLLKHLFDQRKFGKGKISVKPWSETFKSDCAFDLIISDAFGVFGDDRGLEFILNSFVKYLQPWGIVIPEKVMSYVVPVQSSEIYAEHQRMRGFQGVPLFAKRVCRIFSSCEPVRVQNIMFSSEATKPCLPQEFSAIAEFTPDLDFRVHGLVGFFKAVLSEGAMYSNYSRSAEKSWQGFESLMFLPIQESFSAVAGKPLKIEIKKRVENSCTWLEWRSLNPDYNLGSRSDAWINTDGCRFRLSGLSDQGLPDLRLQDLEI